MSDLKDLLTDSETSLLERKSLFEKHKKIARFYFSVVKKKLPLAYIPFKAYLLHHLRRHSRPN